MKIALITDQHFGARKNSKLFHDFFLKFYNDVFFPTLKEEGITTIIDMGDTFDNRTGINFSSLKWAKDNYYDVLESMGCKIHTIVGNHTAFYKNTNNVNAVDLLLREYKNVEVYSEPSEVTIDGLKLMFIPWINKENEETTFKLLKKTTSKIAMGHLELRGFAANKQCIMEHGHESKLFKKFTKVFSGHYHTRSNDQNIHYTGNAYEIYWNDVNDVRGFTIFDTETLEHRFVNNPYSIFHHVYYEDTDYKTFDFSKYQDMIVKVIVRKKSDNKNFEKFIDKFYVSNVADLKIVESQDFNGWYSKDQIEEIESENTLSLLNKYIQESEIDLDKSELSKIIKEVYQEACEMI